MQLGYTVWTWMSQEHNNWERNQNPKIAFEQALREISHLGYQTVENFNWFADYYMENPQEVVDVCGKYGLKFVNLYHYLTPNWQEDQDKGLAYCKFAQKVGAKYMNLQMQVWKDQPYNRPTDREAIEVYAKKATILGKMAKEYGLTLCVHPHANTPVFTMEQIEMLLEMTDPATVSLCLDTGHVTLSGGNAVEAMERYIDRTAYVHLKDVDPDESAHPEWPMKRFQALGQGCVDFQGVFQVLRKHSFEGVVCVELDYQRVCNYESAQYSRMYLKNVIGI